MSLKTRLVTLVLCFVAIAARAHAGSVTLAWDASPDATVAGYVIAYGVQPGLYTDSVDVGPTTTTQLAGLTDGMTYYFSVTAYDGNGQFSDYATEVNGVVGSVPDMCIDTPAAGATVDSTGFVVAGWALDHNSPMGPGVDAVHVWAYPDSGAAPQFVASLGYGNARPDVGAAFGTQFTTSGFGSLVTNLAPGAYTLVAYARSTVSLTFNDVRVVHVTVAAPVSRSTIVIDTPRPSASVSGSFFLSGWAAEFASTAGTGIDAIHVWAYPASGGAPTFAGAAWLGWTRADVGGIFGAQFTTSGYGLMVPPLAPGAYRLVAYARSTVTGTFNASAVVDVVVK